MAGLAWGPERREEFAVTKELMRVIRLKSSAKIAEEAGVGYHQIYHIRRGSRRPSMSLALKLCDQLGVSFEALTLWCYKRQRVWHLIVKPTRNLKPENKPKRRNPQWEDVFEAEEE